MNRWRKKRKYWAANRQFELLEIVPSDVAPSVTVFEAKLKEILETSGVKCKRLSDEEVWLNVKLRALRRFSGAMSGFIGRCRKLWILPRDLEVKLAEHVPLSEIEEWFLALSVILYRDYIERLEANNQQDYDGLMQMAVNDVRSGNTIFGRRNESGDLSKLRYIFIDEYQDFSELFQRLIQAIQKHNPEVQFFCVGDDWQAINGFAGSDLKFYHEFASYFTHAKKLHISTNYRSCTSIVSAGNKLMAGKGPPSLAHNKDQGTVKIADLSKFFPTLIEQEKFKNWVLTPVILRLAAKALSKNQSVVLISRRKELFIPSGGLISIEKYLEIIRKLLPNEWRQRIIVSTAHSFKGRESDVVIIIDALVKKYPLFHPNWIFSRILGESLKEIEDENRRLFYVALTRAKTDLYLITENKKISPYLEEMKKRCNISDIQWDKYPPAIDDHRAIIVRIIGRFYDLTEDLKSDGFQFRKLSGVPVREKNTHWIISTSRT